MIINIKTIYLLYHITIKYIIKIKRTTLSNVEHTSDISYIILNLNTVQACALREKISKRITCTVEEENST